MENFIRSQPRKNYDSLNIKLRSYRKKETKVDAHISVNFSHFSKNFVFPKMITFIAFQRGATHYYDFIF